MNPAVLTSRRGRKISLTALIDVVFILLMFFMLTTGFSHWQALDLPAAAASDTTTSEPPVLLLIGSTGELRLLDQQLSEALSLPQVLARLGDTQALVLSAHETTPVSEIVRIMSALNAAHQTFTLGQPYAQDIDAP